MNRFVSVVMALLFTGMTGCSSLDFSYGESRGWAGRKSINGFGGLRERFRREGFETRDVYRFNERLIDSQVVVWTPKAPSPIATSTGSWLTRWLSKGNRTLVYVIPDSGSLTDYYRTVLPVSDPAQRLEYRRRLARAVNDEMAWRHQRNDLQVRPWFNAESLSSPRPIDKTLTWKNESSEETVPGSTVSGEGDETELAGEYEYVLAPFESEESDTTTTGVTAPMVQFIQEPVGPSTPGYMPNIEPFRGNAESEWLFEPLLTSGNDVLIASIKAPRWNQSELIVVAGGSLVTNFSLAKPAGRSIADRLARRAHANAGESLGIAAFATSDYGNIPVRESNSDVPAPSGMEVLTTWPISLVTIHGLLAGLIFCLIVFPIFGRPRRTRGAAVNHFGGHLDAVATLMAKTNGHAYAKSRLTEYRRRVNEQTN